MTSDKFAYGADVVEDEEGNECQCPSVKAGHDTKRPEISKVAGKYDDLLIEDDEYLGSVTGVVSEEKAKETWLEVIDHFESHEYVPYVESAKEIAEELGWLQ